ncbi:hypothetical protein EG328_003095 [Venturia inaequalis]|uniref:Uncharacterized protein n=1 Tax=Venturia inaequalis TaxID=5025 RepID=A0A8H3US98_VENIN|nr:hypothetical protein EG328_003095 [Venturia inaequalis]
MSRVTVSSQLGCVHLKTFSYIDDTGTHYDATKDETNPNYVEDFSWREQSASASASVTATATASSVEVTGTGTGTTSGININIVGREGRRGKFRCNQFCDWVARNAHDGRCFQACVMILYYWEGKDCCQKF